MSDPVHRDPTAHLKALSDRLEQWDEAFLQARESGRWADCLAGYTGVLAILLVGLGKLPGFQARLATLADLMLRLDELAAGNNSMPVPKRSGVGRPPSARRASIIQGRAVAGVEILIRCGEPEAAAAEFVAKHLRKFGVTGRQGQPVTARTVRDWRSKVRDETAFCEKPDARELYLAALNNWDELVTSELPLYKVKKAVAHIVAPANTPSGRILANPHLSG
jgi:hypothetical protein